MSELNIYQRVNEIRKSVSYVQKDKKVTGYKAVGHDQVTAVLRAALVEFGVVVTQSLIESSFEETGSLTGSGNKWMMYTAKYAVKLVNVDTPDDFIEVITESQALDTGDKASGKAMSYAVKYAMLKTFSLETGEDEEGRQGDIQQKKDDEEKQKANVEINNQLNKYVDDAELSYLACGTIAALESMSKGDLLEVKKMCKQINRNPEQPTNKLKSFIQARREQLRNV